MKLDGSASMAVTSCFITLRECNGSQICISVRICQPRVWGAEAPSSKPEWLKIHEVGFELRRRNLLFENWKPSYNKSRFERAYATAGKRKFWEKVNWQGMETWRRRARVARQRLRKSVPGAKRRDTVCAKERSTFRKRLWGESVRYE